MIIFYFDFAPSPALLFGVCHIETRTLPFHFCPTLAQPSDLRALATRSASRVTCILHRCKPLLSSFTHVQGIQTANRSFFSVAVKRRKSRLFTIATRPEFGDASHFIVHIGPASGPSGSKERIAARRKRHMNPIIHLLTID